VTVDRVALGRMGLGGLLPVPELRPDPHRPARRQQSVVAVRTVEPRDPARAEALARSVFVRDGRGAGGRTGARLRTQRDDGAMKTIWLSFTDPTKEVDRFLGVALVDVTIEEASDALIEIEVKFPQHLPGAEWIFAANRKAHGLGCNPGGEVASWEVPAGLAAPRGRLMMKAALEARGLA